MRRPSRLLLVAERRKNIRMEKGRKTAPAASCARAETRADYRRTKEDKPVKVTKVLSVLAFLAILAVILFFTFRPSTNVSDLSWMPQRWGLWFDEHDEFR